SAQTQSVGGTAICRSQRLAWPAPLPLATALARQLRSLAHRGWPKSQAAAQKARVGTPPVPNRGLLCLFLGPFAWWACPQAGEGVVPGPIGTASSMIRNPGGSFLLMGLLRTFSTGCSVLDKLSDMAGTSLRLKEKEC